MFYRRKIILALIQLFDNRLEKIRLQKLLFLFSQKQIKPTYDFIPYRFGCYSFSANADMTTMATKGMLIEEEKLFIKNDPINYFNQLNDLDKIILREVYSQFGNLSKNELIKFTYLNYPYFTSKSEIAENILDKAELDKVKKSINRTDNTILFTIGYEGISLEEYFNRLLINDIKILVDVRNNPLSMKFGFSKSQLKKYCLNLGLQYIHLPELGISSEQRKALNTQSDYDELFTLYRENNLTKTIDSQYTILELLKQNKRIALTCFESNICQCHRSHLAEAIKNLPEFNFQLKHI